MTTRAHDSDPTGSSHAGAQPFAGLGAGLGFFQDWMKAAGAAMPGMSAPTGAGIPGVPSWSVPTLDPDELDKRIQELKTVQFWLEQNSRMIAMTIQGMEVQKMTLSTLKGMNVSMDALRDTLKAQPAPAAAPLAGCDPSWGDAPRQSGRGLAGRPCGGSGRQVCRVADRARPAAPPASPPAPRPRPGSAYAPDADAKAAPPGPGHDR